MSRGAVVWITGLPSSGKSTLALAAHEHLDVLGIANCVLDGDAVRAALVPPQGYDELAREQFYETLANLSLLLARQGLVVLVAATAHRRAYRERARLSGERFLEVWLEVPLEECRRRDSKRLYADFSEGRATGVPGEDLAYEPPERPDVVARGGADADAVARVTDLIARGR